MIRKITISLILVALILLTPLTALAWEESGEGGVTVRGPPAPEITYVSVEETARWGKWITIVVEARNDGDKADEMYLSVSFPDNPSLDRIQIVSGFNKPTIHPPGKEVWGGYGTKKVTLSYPLVEDYKAPWPRGESNTLEVKVKPHITGPFRVYIKAVAYGAGEWRYDPYSGTKDQQDEYVYEYTSTIFVGVDITKFYVTMDRGETKETSITVKNRNFDPITVESFKVTDYGGFKGSITCVTIEEARSITIEAGSSVSLILRVTASEDCLPGTYTVKFKLSGKP